MAKRKTKTDRDGLYERSGSPYFWASYSDGSGKRVRRSTGVKVSTAGRQEAEALLSKWRLEAHQERQWGQQLTRTFDEMMLGYLRELEQVGKSTERAKWSLKKLYPEFTGMELHSITPQHVRCYIAKRKEDGVANSTINREVGFLSAAFNFARREWDWDVGNPAANRRQKEPEGRLRWLSEAEAKRLIYHASAEDRPPYLADFVVFALNTGCRRSEILNLEWSRVDLKQNLVFFEAAHTKSRKRRSIPLNKSAREALMGRLKYRMQDADRASSPWVFCTEKGKRIGDIKKTWGTTRKRAGLTDVRIHDLRHTCAAWLVSAGVPLAEVRDLLGHSSITMTERYAHLSPDNVRAAVMHLDALPQNEQSSQSAGAKLVTITSQ
jgi:integrase